MIYYFMQRNSQLLMVAEIFPFVDIMCIISGCEKCTWTLVLVIANAAVAHEVQPLKKRSLSLKSMNNVVHHCVHLFFSCSPQS